jgi:hypothetical protein
LRPHGRRTTGQAAARGGGAAAHGGGWRRGASAPPMSPREERRGGLRTVISHVPLPPLIKLYSTEMLRYERNSELISLKEFVLSISFI